MERDFENKKKPQWLSAHVVVLVTALNFNLFSFVAISTSLENNKIQMNWNLFSGDELLISLSRAVYFSILHGIWVTKSICQCLSCAWEKQSTLKLKPLFHLLLEVLLMYTLNVRLTKIICVTPPTCSLSLNCSSATSQERDLFFFFFLFFFLLRLHEKLETAWRDQRFSKIGSEVMDCWMT